MTADVVDLDTLETGEDRTAMHFAVSSFIVKDRSGRRLYPMRLDCVGVSPDA